MPGIEHFALTRTTHAEPAILCGLQKVSAGRRHHIHSGGSTAHYDEAQACSAPVRPATGLASEWNP